MRRRRGRGRGAARTAASTSCCSAPTASAWSGKPSVDAAYRCGELDIAAFDDSEPEPLASIQRAEVEREARRLGDALGLAVDWAAVGRLDDEMLVNAIAQVAPFDVGAKQALLEEATLTGRADLLVQLMQFHRMAVTGGVEIEPTLQ